MLHLRDHVTPPKSHIRSRVSLHTRVDVVVDRCGGERETLLSRDTVRERREGQYIVSSYYQQIFMPTILNKNVRSE